jgi:hypothetical protein
VSYQILNCMKTFVYFLIALLAVSCLKPGKNSYYIRTTGRVEIIHADIPDTSTVNQNVDLKARAEASNACWSNLSFVLTKKKDFEYNLEAFGIYESTGSCEDLMVYGDTTIVFKPTVTGQYIFKVTKSETETQTDTLNVVSGI